MQFIIDIWAWLHSAVGANLLLALLAISEALGGIPFIKQSSIYQLVLDGLKKILSLLGISKPPIQT